ncbi:MAG: hypothetical protein GXP55_26170 [Deltaproteobacteria bacterium]|nr:hypothetical protein [Deltaproteobacteria bacterium]
MSEQDIWANVERVEPLPTGALVHPRVLDLPETEGRSLVFSCFADVPSSRALFGALRPALEAAWLSELSSPACAAPRIEQLQLFCFGAVPADAHSGVRAFGFRPTPMDERAEELLPKLRAEASRANLPVPEHATELFRADVQYTQASDSESLESLAVALEAEVFGERPGALGRALLAHFEPELPGLDADLQSLDRIEGRLFVDRPDVVRGILPTLFAPLADLVGVCLSRELGHEVGWGVSELDAAGRREAPLLQVGAEDSAPLLFPVGLELLRRCVMPRGRDEDIAPLSHWLEQSFPRQAS